MASYGAKVEEICITSPESNGDLGGGAEYYKFLHKIRNSTCHLCDNLFIMVYLIVCVFYIQIKFNFSSILNSVMMKNVVLSSFCTLRREFEHFICFHNFSSCVHLHHFE